MTKRTFEAFLIRDPRVLKTEIRPTPYTFTEREDHRVAQRMGVLVRNYCWENGSVLSRNIRTFPYQEWYAQYGQK